MVGDALNATRLSQSPLKAIPSIHNDSIRISEDSSTSEGSIEVVQVEVEDELSVGNGVENKAHQSKQEDLRVENAQQKTLENQLDNSTEQVKNVEVKEQKDSNSNLYYLSFMSLLQNSKNYIF